MELDLSEALVFGELDVVRVQRVLFAARAWITEQEGMTSHGRALVVWHAYRLPVERLAALVRCFERVVAHAPRAELPALLANLRAAGARVDEGLSLVAAAASDARAAADANERRSPLPPGFTLAELAAGATEEEIRAVQELQAAVGQTPLPGWYLRGAEGRAITLALRDPAGAVAGVSTVCAASGPAAPGAQPAATKRGEVPPLTGTPVCTCLRDDLRGRGLSPALTGAALRAGFERLGLRWFYGLVGADDEIAIRMAIRCGFAPHPSETAVLGRPA